MKILFLFCDMLRANQLKTFNYSVKDKQIMDYWFDKLGGTHYTNCYTPAPDTPRSLACMYSGRYPKYNGCYRRLYWPNSSLNKNMLNIFDIFNKHNYHITTYSTQVKDLSRVFPQNNHINTKYYNLDKYLKNIKNDLKTKNNLFSFIVLDDFHWGIEDYGSNEIGIHYGQTHLSNTFKKIFDKVNPDSFDYIFIFSDHGFKKDNENKNLLSLDGDRTNIVMSVRKKGSKQIKKVTDLTSILDILPTIQEILKDKIKIKSDGFSLFKPNKKRLIVLEDYLGFLPQIEDLHKLWGVKTNEYLYLTDITTKYLLKTSSRKICDEKNNKKIIKLFENEIGIHSYSYNEKIKIKTIYQKHINLKTGQDYKNIKKRLNLYSDGKKRQNKFKFIKIINKYILKYWFWKNIIKIKRI